MTLGLTVTNARQWQTIYYINFDAVYETSGTGIMYATYAVHVVHGLNFIVVGIGKKRKEGRKVRGSEGRGDLYTFRNWLGSKLGELLK